MFSWKLNDDECFRLSRLRVHLYAFYLLFSYFIYVVTLVGLLPTYVFSLEFC